jgi:cob(I)alamin adenosyltransferase
MTNFYSRTGDDGFTGMLGEGRIPKYHPRTEAVGVIDEASAALGMARSLCQSDHVRNILIVAQQDLYKMMAELSATPENVVRFRSIQGTHIQRLEEEIEKISGKIENPHDFILPGDSAAGAALDLARTIVRRAERRAAGLYHSGEITNPTIMQYLNRLSSLCFVLEIMENQIAGIPHPRRAKDK